MLEEFHLPKTLCGFLARLIWAAEILATLLRNHLVPALHFFNHGSPPEAILSPRIMESIQEEMETPNRGLLYH
jgi:hypothetical protein